MIKKIFEFYFRCYKYFRLDIDQSTVDYKSLCTVDTQLFSFKILNRIEDIKYFHESKFSAENLQLIQTRLSKPKEFTCFLFIENATNKVAMMAWINTSPSYYIYEMNKHVKYQSHQALFENSVTWPEFQRKGLYISMLCNQIEYSKQNKITEAFAVVYFKNIAPLKTLAKLGFKRIDKFPIYYRTGSITYTIKKILRIKNDGSAVR